MFPNYKLGFGPMSEEIIDCLLEYSTTKSYPLMIIASRNQVDHNGGYVCTTEELAGKIKRSNANVLLCRDHCGPYFKDSDVGLPADMATFKAIDTVDCDISNQFNLIHVDVSKIPQDQIKFAESIINYILKIKPNMHLEFGSEENLGVNLEESNLRVDEQLAFLQQYKQNVYFYTTQTGSLVKHTQVGGFNKENNKRLAEKIHASGFKFKEHNADYLNAYDIKWRTEAGVDALNIAPQLGYLQTRVLYSCTHKHPDTERLWDDFSEMIYKKGSWGRWLPSGLRDKHLAVLAAGHYHFKSDEYKRLIDKIDYDVFYNQVQTEVFKLVDLYRIFE